MHILLTGAAGLVGGGCLHHILSTGQHTVLATDVVPLPKTAPSLTGDSTFIEADLTQIKDTDKVFDSSPRPIDAVIHCGAIPNPDGKDYRMVHNINVTAHYNVLYTAASRGIKRIVQASSVNATGLSYSDNQRRLKVYQGCPKWGLPLREHETPFAPEDGYSEYNQSFQQARKGVT